MATIGGIERNLGAWKQSRLRLRSFRPSVVDVQALPKHWTIEGFPTDYDQGQLGSCGPNSVAEVFDFHLKDRYSRLFLYFATRMAEHDVGEDAGVEIPDLMAAAQAMGMPLETTWPYHPEWFACPPPITAYLEAPHHRIRYWDLIADLDHMLYEIANDQPVTLGFKVPASMQGDECYRTGLVRVPSADDPVIGGHCVNAIGFDRERDLVQCTCHYGATFGDAGCIWLPFEMFTAGYAMDMTAIREVT